MNSPFRFAVLIASCLVQTLVVVAEERVMARAVPERKDDFVFENELVCYRIYGRALEPRPTSPGIDVWVKLPGRLVADEWYAMAVEDPGYSHRNHGGKDCYQTGRSLGAGASSPLVDGCLAFPSTNYRSFEVVRHTADTVVFALHYPEWTVSGIVFSLDKTFTVAAGTRFTRVDDVWHMSGSVSEADVMAGLFRHPKKHAVEDEMLSATAVAIWEHASDTKHEPEEGMIGLAVVMPSADRTEMLPDGSHVGCVRRVRDGETLTYYIASAWSRSGIRTSKRWMRHVGRFSDGIGGRRGAHGRGK